jgi:hypothetical protein
MGRSCLDHPAFALFHLAWDPLASGLLFLSFSVHFRALTAMYLSANAIAIGPFLLTPTDMRNNPDVCDILAVECSDWVRHCMVHHKRSSWHSLRARARSRTGISLVIPDNVLPPKLRVRSSSDPTVRSSFGGFITFMARDCGNRATQSTSGNRWRRNAIQAWAHLRLKRQSSRMQPAPRRRLTQRLMPMPTLRPIIFQLVHRPTGSSWNRTCAPLLTE